MKYHGDDVHEWNRYVFSKHLRDGIEHSHSVLTKLREQRRAQKVYDYPISVISNAQARSDLCGW